LLQVAIVSGVILIVILGSFILTCQNKKKQEENEQEKPSRVGKAD